MCGLFGFIGKEKTEFNKLLLCNLGIHNDTRGGDSCGLFIDGDVEYGVDDKKKFDSFYKTSKLFNKTKKAQIIIGHDRKTSVGVTSLENAQPVVITNDNDEVDFVLIHNGTISNYEDLRDKYLTNAEGYTDSQVMAYIIYFWGYDVLSEYIGTGAFVTVDYRQNKERKPVVHIFKGASKKYKTSNTDEERPLFLLKDTNGYWFSSLKEHLERYNNVYLNDKGFVSIETNTLYMIEGYQLYKVQEYDRSNLVQIELSSSNTYSSTYKSTSKDPELPLVYNPSYPYYNDYDIDDYDWGTVSTNNKTTETNKESSNELVESHPGLFPDELPVEVPNELNNMCTLEVIQYLKKTHSPDDTTLAYDRVYFDGCIYMDGDLPADGIYSLSKSGLKINQNNNFSVKNFYAFVNGNLLYHPKILVALDLISEYYDCYPYDILDTMSGKSNYFNIMPYFDTKTSTFISAKNKVIDNYKFIMPLQSPDSFIKSYIKNGMLSTKDVKKQFSIELAKEFYKDSFAKYLNNYDIYDKMKLQTLINKVYESIIA